MKRKVAISFSAHSTLFRNAIIFVVLSSMFLGTLRSTFSSIAATQKAEASPTYIPNNDLVKAGPYDSAASGPSNWGCSVIGYREFITIGQQYRIRENGIISRLRLYTANKTNLTGFYLKIWRKNGSNYDLVGASDNLASSIGDGTTATIDLSTPIVGVQEGDYYGYRIEVSAPSYNFYAKTGVTGVTSYLVTNLTPTDANYNWSGQAAIASTVLPIELYMQAPQAALIGDSIIAGHPGNYSFLEKAATTNISSTIGKQLSNFTGYTYQNMGIGSQTTTNISARFANDIIALKPRIAIIEGGVNDIAGSVSKSTFLENYTTMLDLAQADPAISRIIVLKILPWTNGTNVQMKIRDDWNASLVTLTNGHSKAQIVDTSSYVGQSRDGGDVGNLWDIQPAYDAGGVHYNQAGHAQIAQAIADTINNLPTNNNPPEVSNFVVAKFNAPTSHAFNLPFIFDAIKSLSTIGIAKYHWDFGDGTTSEAMKVDHRYQSPGRYIAALTVTDNAGKTSTQKHTIDANPTKPTIDDIAVDGHDLVFKGKSYSQTIVHLEIHSNPLLVQTDADNEGDWTYRVSGAEDTLGTGDHVASASASYILADSTELKSESSDAYDFKISFEDGKLNVETQKTKIKTWSYISSGLIILLIAVFVFYCYTRKRKRRFILLRLLIRSPKSYFTHFFHRKKKDHSNHT